MIFTDRKITIRNGKSSINEPVILYRGDFEVSIRFTIMESKFRFKSGVNLVDSEKASYGQLAILAPYGGNVFSEVVKCEDGTVTFTLTKEMIDQLEEVGLYSFQIRLFDYYRESRVSIPPVEFGIEVREPVASEDHDNEVNNAIVGYSIAKVVDGLNEDVPDTFDSKGQYNKTDWETGDRISEGKLNKIEDAMDKINRNEINDKNALNKRITSNFNVLTSQLNNLVLESGGDSNLEVVQARSDIFGNNFDTLGTRISNIEKTIEGLPFIFSPNDWTNGGIQQNGIINNNNYYIRSSIKHDINPGDEITITTCNGYSGTVAWFDINGNFVKREAYVIDNTATYIAPSSKFMLMLGFGDGTTTVDKSIKSNMIVTINRKKDAKANVLVINEWEPGAIFIADGTENNINTFIRTKNYHFAYNGYDLKLNISEGFKARVHFYNENKEYVGATEYIQGESTVTVLDIYFRVILARISGSETVSVPDSSNLNIRYTKIKNNNELDASWNVGAITKSDGQINDLPAYLRTDKITLTTLKQLEIKVYNGFKARVHFYDEQDKQISFTEYFTETLTIVSKSLYFRVLFTLDEKTPLSLALIGNITILCNEYKNEYKEENRLAGKTVYSFGDSLVAGHYSGEGILDGLVEQNNMVYTKYAKNGYTIRGTQSSTIYYQINNASNIVPDFVVFDGLTNDAYDDIVSSYLGEMSNHYNGSYDTNTFIGSFENICYTLRNKYQNANIIYVAPHRMPNRSENAQNVLQDMAKKVCAKWSIPVVDIYNGGQINTYIEGFRNDYSYNNTGETSGGNGTHLTGEGYNKFYAPLIKSKMLSLLE